MSESFDWFRKHPVTATVAAIIAAAYSLAQFNSEELDEYEAKRAGSSGSSSTSTPTSAGARPFEGPGSLKPNGDRGISWGDDNGGRLTEIIKAKEDAEGLNEYREYNTSDEHLYGSSESIESFGPSDESNKDNKQASSKPGGASASGESSPNFGWFVSFTPPQKLYRRTDKS